MTVLWDSDTEDANWISELQRSKGRIPPDAVDVTDTVKAWASDTVEMAYDPNQPRDQVGRFGHKSGVAPSGQLGAPTVLDDFPPEAQAKFHARAAELGSDFPQTPEEMADVVLAAYAKATPDQIERGLNWYGQAHDQLVGMAKAAGVPDDQAFAVMAVCSPRTRWEKNQQQAAAILKVHGENAPFEISQETYDKMRDKPPHGPGTYKPEELSGSQLSFAHPQLKAVRNLPFGDHCEAAFKILRGEPITNVVSGTKVRNFYNNMRDPSDPTSVTIDAWQVRAMVKPGGKLPVPRYKTLPDGTKVKVPFTATEEADTQTYFDKPRGKKVGIEDRTGMYPYFGTAAQIAAKRINPPKGGILPHQLQAITWLVTQGGDSTGGSDE